MRRSSRAIQPGDVSLGDLPEMKRVLDGARRAGRIEASDGVRFWVTEFAWDTNPPDAGGVPPRLHARWVSEALYRMWRAGVSQVTWFQLRDNPLSRAPGGNFQAGLYFVDGQAKPAMRAIRFPFVAFSKAGRRVAVWGRTPTGRADSLVIEQRRAGAWRRLRTVRSDADGMVQRTLARRGGGPLRARIRGTKQRSRPFSLVRPPDRNVNPFGTGAAPEDG
jgi:hypothetical protein